MMFSPPVFLIGALSIGQFVSTTTAFSPFFQQVSDAQWVIGNDVWNITISSTYGKKLFYKDKDLIGNAVGHYASTSKCFPFHSPGIVLGAPTSLLLGEIVKGNGRCCSRVFRSIHKCFLIFTNNTFDPPQLSYTIQLKLSGSNAHLSHFQTFGKISSHHSSK